ncbi:MAG: hypothetical protein IJZ51_02295 [Ruminiclostridium sp.]|nr:hypothetical protein [Ruminiclostridium sp.]
MGYSIGEHVVYGHSGVCRIEEIATREFDGKKQDYYLLRPVAHNNATVFVPCDNEKLVSAMRYPISSDEIDRLLTEIDGVDIEWIEDKRERPAFFKSVMQSGDRKQILKVIRCIYIKKQALMNSNRSLPSTDEKILQELERMINDEFSYSLGIGIDEVSGYIADKIRSK